MDKQVLTALLEEEDIDVDKVLSRALTEFDYAGTLYSLDLSGLGLTSVPDLSRFRGLNTVELAFNKICELDVLTFSKNLRLMKINLGNNELTSLPPGVFDKLTVLQQLSLSRNSIKVLPDEVFKRTVNVHTLLMGHNSLVSLPSSLRRLKSLRYLDLKDCGKFDVILTTREEVEEFLLKAL